VDGNLRWTVFGPVNARQHRVNIAAHQVTPTRVLPVIVCSAGPATAIGTFVGLAQERGWRIQVIATPAALDFFDPAVIEKQTGSPIRSQYSKPGAPRSQIPDAIIVAPASYNTINKWALGVSDTYALDGLAEAAGLDVPVVVLPFVNTALARRPPFRRSVEALRAEGVRIPARQLHIHLAQPGIRAPEPSNQVSNNHHRQRRTSADADRWSSQVRFAQRWQPACCAGQEYESSRGPSRRVPSPHPCRSPMALEAIGAVAHSSGAPTMPRVHRPT